MIMINFILTMIVINSIVITIYNFKFYIQYLLEIFEEKDIRYKEQLTDFRSKLFCIDRKEVLGRIRARNPFFYYYSPVSAILSAIFLLSIDCDIFCGIW